MSGSLRVIANDTGSLREEFELANIILKHAVSQNIAEFRFSSLRIPAVIRNWEAPGMPLRPEKVATEVAIFQEHLFDRIASLASNQRMTREIWRFNDKTRDFRERTLADLAYSGDIIVCMSTLVNGLFTQKTGSVVSALDFFNRRNMRLLGDHHDGPQNLIEFSI